MVADIALGRYQQPPRVYSQYTLATQGITCTYIIIYIDIYIHVYTCALPTYEYINVGLHYPKMGFPSNISVFDVCFPPLSMIVADYSLDKYILLQSLIVSMY